MKELRFNKGEVIIREGDMGGSFYRILQGSTEVVSGCGTEKEKKLTTLGKGELFGELGSFEGYPRSASVLAAEDDTIVQEVADEEVDKLFREDSGTIIAVMKQMSRRIRELTAEYQELNARMEKAKPEGKPVGGLLNRILRFLRGGIGDAGVQEGQDEKKASLKDGYSCKVNSCPQGTVVFREGEPGNCMYAIHSGSVGIYADYGTPQETMLTSLFADRFFGEMGMIDQLPRTATAVVLEPDTVLETIYPGDLADLFEKNPSKVLMIVQNLSRRVRRLSQDVAEAKMKEQDYE